MRGQGKFRDCDPGYVHIDEKHLPKLQTANGDRRKRFLYVAIDRRSSSVHLAVYDAENADNSVDFSKAIKEAFPFRITAYPDRHAEVNEIIRFEQRVLPPYNPDFMSIETCFLKPKTVLHNAAPV
ncbi:hypothetical protein ACFFLJ_11835 [Acetobacter farinalis]|uniref:hypothetical protein n=1 Tax=Acetobacter farinalis TaxID=1260984 RepID=UPI0035F3566D